MKDYRIQEVNGAFELQERDSGTKKHFKIPYYNKGLREYETHAEAQTAMNENLRLQSLSTKEALAEFREFCATANWGAK